MLRVGLLVGLAALAGAGCVVEPAFVEGEFAEGGIGVWRFGLQLADAPGCSTAIAAGLSAQLIEVESCLHPGALESFAGDPGISYDSAVNPYLEPPARAALNAAVAEVGATITINSALRTLAQQYLLKKWEGGCGIQLAATPGSSNHETGLAIDTPDRAIFQAALEARGWAWFGSTDAVHFDYAGPGGVDLRPDSVLAFQYLWNHNNPNDPLVEDSDYGPQTAARLATAPVDGFPSVPSCPDPGGDGGAGDLAGTDAGSGDGGARGDGAVRTDGPVGDLGHVPPVTGCSAAPWSVPRGWQGAGVPVIVLVGAWVRRRRRGAAGPLAGAGRA